MIHLCFQHELSKNIQTSIRNKRKSQFKASDIFQFIRSQMLPCQRPVVPRRCFLIVISDGLQTIWRLVESSDVWTFASKFLQFQFTVCGQWNRISIFIVLPKTVTNERNNVSWFGESKIYVILNHSGLNILKVTQTKIEINFEYTCSQLRIVIRKVVLIYLFKRVEQSKISIDIILKLRSIYCSFCLAKKILLVLLFKL